MRPLFQCMRRRSRLRAGRVGKDVMLQTSGNGTFSEESFVELESGVVRKQMPRQGDHQNESVLRLRPVLPHQGFVPSRVLQVCEEDLIVWWPIPSLPRPRDLVRSEAGSLCCGHEVRTWHGSGCGSGGMRDDPTIREWTHPQFLGLRRVGLLWG